MVFAGSTITKRVSFSMHFKSRIRTFRNSPCSVFTLFYQNMIVIYSIWNISHSLLTNRITYNITRPVDVPILVNVMCGRVGNHMYKFEVPRTRVTCAVIRRATRARFAFNQTEIGILPLIKTHTTL